MMLIQILKDITKLWKIQKITPKIRELRNKCTQIFLYVHLSYLNKRWSEMYRKQIDFDKQC